MAVDEKERTITVSLPEELIAKILIRAEEGADPERCIKSYVYAAVKGRVETDEELDEWRHFCKLSPVEREGYLKIHPQYREKFR